MPVNNAKIRKMREAAGLNQKDAADLAGFTSKQAWSQIEAGTRKNITVDTLERIAKAVGCKAAELLR